MVGTVERAFAPVPTATFMMRMTLLSCIVVHCAARTFTILATGASSNDHVLAGWEGHWSIDFHFHRFDLRTAVLGHRIEALYTRKSQSRSWDVFGHRSVVIEHCAEESIHICQRTQSRRRQLVCRRAGPATTTSFARGGMTT
jgi:hypothetical protein